MYKKPDEKTAARSRKKLILGNARTAQIRRLVSERRASAMKWPNSHDMPEVSNEVMLSKELRDSLPAPEETQAFGLWPEKLDALRRNQLEGLYANNALFKKLVDELRKNKKHYINQLSLV